MCGYANYSRTEEVTTGGSVTQGTVSWNLDRTPFIAPLTGSPGPRVTPTAESCGPEDVWYLAFPTAATAGPSGDGWGWGADPQPPCQSKLRLHDREAEPCRPDRLPPSLAGFWDRASFGLGTCGPKRWPEEVVRWPGELFKAQRRIPIGTIPFTKEKARTRSDFWCFWDAKSSLQNSRLAPHCTGRCARPGRPPGRRAGTHERLGAGRWVCAVDVLGSSLLPGAGS